MDAVYLHETNLNEWENAGQPGPRAEQVATLAELVSKLNRDQPLWEELSRFSTDGRKQWKAIIKEQDKPRGGPDRHHRLDLYVPPLLRVEGELRQRDEGAMKQEPIESLLVPGNELSDEPMSNLLALSLGENPEVDWEFWQSARKPNEEADESTETSKVDEQGAAPEWLVPGRDLLIYDTAGAGKSVLTLRIAHLLNDCQLWPAIFDTEQPTLVMRIEGVWPKRDGELLPLREMVFETALRQLEHPGTEAARYLREDAKSKLRKAIDFAFAKRRLVLILDGFDQFASNAREHIVEEHDTDDGRSCRWIIASRQHTIATLFGSSRRSRDWLRVRIERFNERQRDEFFRKAGLADIWQQYVNPESEAMAEMLQLPVVLDQLREFIVNRIETAKESAGDKPDPVEFESISELALVTSRLSLDRALDPRKIGENKPPKHLKDSATVQLNTVEHVLSLIAFELLLQSKEESGDEWNGLILGRKKKEEFLERCQDRFHRIIDLQLLQFETKTKPELGDERKREKLRERSEQNKLAWDWAMRILSAIELHHRTYVEQNADDILAFRDRKAVEFYAARYLTRYATEWDIFADYPEDKREVEVADSACAWQRISDKQWDNTWELAIDMPRLPLPGSASHTFAGAVLDPWASCLSFSALFRQTLSGERRPTEWLWRCWPMFEYDRRRALDSRYRFDGKLVTGHELVSQGLDEELGAMAKRQVLSDGDDRSRVRDLRVECLAMFRDSNRELVEQIKVRTDTILLDDGTRCAVPSGKEGRKALMQWQTQTSEEKSLTFLQCPPQAWIAAYKSEPDQNDDPRINSAIEGQGTEVLHSLQMQATPVSRGMFFEFDPHFDNREAIADSLEQEPWQDFPMVDANWFDAFVFGKWLGPNFRLPDDFEWELATRAGTTTEYHFGDRLSGDLANCDGNYPYPQDADHPQKNYLDSCTPVGLAKYPCNPWGLFDVHGNVDEWCASVDEGSESSRSLRGGSWYDLAIDCRSSRRHHVVPDYRYDNIGFRLCFE